MLVISSTSSTDSISSSYYFGFPFKVSGGVKSILSVLFTLIMGVIMLPFYLVLSDFTPGLYSSAKAVGVELICSILR